MVLSIKYLIEWLQLVVLVPFCNDSCLAFSDLSRLTYSVAIEIIDELYDYTRDACVLPKPLLPRIWG